MNIGFFTDALPYLPAREGFRLYAANILKGLAARHKVDLISILEPGDEDQLEWARGIVNSVTVLTVPQASLSTRIGRLVKGMWLGSSLDVTRSFQPVFAELARKNQWDVLHVEGKLAATFAPQIGLPRVLALHDSWTWRYREMRRSSPTLAEKLRYAGLSLREPWVERALYPQYECCTLVGRLDTEEVRRVVPSARVECIPNGADTEYFRPVPLQRDRRTLVFHSRLDYSPNVVAAMEFADNIFPRIRQAVPDAAFHLSGACPTPEVRALASRPGVKTFFDLPDIRPALAPGDVYVCAIRFGTGVKNKLLEAMAMGIPCVTYPEGIGGIDCVPGQHLLVANDAAGFAGAVVQLLQDPDEAAAMAARARALVVEKYSWASRVEAYESLYEGILQAHKREASALVATGVVRAY